MILQVLTSPRSSCAPAKWACQFYSSSLQTAVDESRLNNGNNNKRRFDHRELVNLQSVNEDENLNWFHRLLDAAVRGALLLTM